MDQQNIEVVTATAADDDTEASADDEALATVPPHILVVDDDPDVLFALTETLIAAGYTVYGAHDGIEALDAIAERRPDLIITDLLMPTMTGFELLGALHDDPALASIPTLIVTGARLPPEQRAPGAVFSKPLDLDRLLRAITAYTTDPPDPRNLS
jgi:CheY-like chemotaxis protein